ncbi:MULTISPECIES: hypothetical protein [unclassified Spirillospora]|uniref:hypothetical protein n=1 Tax=unclassified Spirillospora TaxID=2642701 RepID=UPI003715BA2A
MVFVEVGFGAVVEGLQDRVAGVDSPETAGRVMIGVACSPTMLKVCADGGTGTSTARAGSAQTMAHSSETLPTALKTLSRPSRVGMWSPSHGASSSVSSTANSI